MQENKKSNEIKLSQLIHAPVDKCCETHLLLSMSPVIAGSSAKVPLLKYVSPDAVTVFEDRARVHRRLAVEVGVGSSEVCFFGLPARQPVKGEAGGWEGKRGEARERTPRQRISL